MKTESVLRAGTSSIDITPPIGTLMAGYSARSQFSTGVHDPLMARVLVAGSGDSALVIASCDLIAIWRGLAEKLRRCAEGLGVPPSNVMVAAYHNHSGPVPDMGLEGLEKWSDDVTERLCGCVRSALGRLAPCRLYLSRAEVHGATVNRRRPLDGPVDEELTCLSWVGASPVCHLVNFSCHAVTLGPDNTLISSDFPGYLNRAVEAETGGMCAYLNGACGDINPLTESLRARLESGEDVYDRTGGTFDEARLLGQRLANAVLLSLPGLEVEDAPIAGRTIVEEVPVKLGLPRSQLKDQYSLQKEDVHRLESSNAPAQQLYLSVLRLFALERLLRFSREGCARVEIQGIRIGRVVLLGFPGELFVETGIRIKNLARQMELEPVIVEIANDYLGYLPTEKAFGEGGYEVENARSLGFGPDLERRIIEGARRLLASLCDL